MRVRALLNQAEKALRQSSSAALDAEILLAFVLKKNRAWLFAHGDDRIAPALARRYKKLIARRARHEPIAYLTGHKEFFGLDFLVSRRTLVPRPETELITAEILKNARADKKIKTAADIGTGSGCIAITLSKLCPRLKLFATDSSAGALRMAKKNARRHGVKIIFKRGNLMTPLKNIRLDAILANLPYLPAAHKHILPSSDVLSLKHEPQNALYAGADGLDAYRKLLAQIKSLKYRPRFVYLEIGPAQATAIKNIVRQNFSAARLKIKKDLAGRERVAVIKF